MLFAGSFFLQIPQHGRYFCHTPYLIAASNSSLHLLEHFFIFLIHVGEVFSFSKLFHGAFPDIPNDVTFFGIDRKSTRLNSSHVAISYAVFCLKKKRPLRTIEPTSHTPV